MRRFDPKIVKTLPALEKAMTAHGVDPADFVIAKNWAAGPRLPIYYRPDGNPVGYTSKDNHSASGSPTT